MYQFIYKNCACEQILSIHKIDEDVSCPLSRRQTSVLMRQASWKRESHPLFDLQRSTVLLCSASDNRAFVTSKISAATFKVNVWPVQGDLKSPSGRVVVRPESVLLARFVAHDEHQIGLVVWIVASIEL